jgi:hypothetical protein
MPYTSLNGHMYSYFTKDEYLALRLPEAERNAFMEKYGIIQKEYVVVPDDLLKNTGELLHYFEISRDYVHTLKPKPGKKK